MAVVGPRDAAERQVSVRIRGRAENAGVLGLSEFVDGLAQEYRSRGAASLAERFAAAT